MKTLLTNVKLLIDGKFIDSSVLIDGEKISEVGNNLYAASDTAVIDGKGGYVSYGFIDPHVHFRTPGATDKEDWRSGSNAALAGGFTYVLDMPNNTPPATSFQVLSMKDEIARRESCVNYGFYLGLTEENSKELPLILQKCAQACVPVYGIKVFLGASTGSLLVENLEAVERAFATGLPVLFHGEDNALLKKNVSFVSLMQHEADRPAEAEVSAIRKIRKAAEKYRDIAKIYICHLSSSAGLKEALLLREDGFTVYLEATPHHLALSLDSMEASSFAKVNPPIRYKEDLLALQSALAIGQIDCIGTDHAPHCLAEKNADNPPSGFPGLETAFYVLNSLVQQHIVSLEQVLQKLTCAYRIFGLAGYGEIKAGNYADLVLLQQRQVVFNASQAKTKAKFSPFDGIVSSLAVEKVLLHGKIVKQ